MSSHRDTSPQANKLSPAAMRRLIEQYNIVFEGLLTPSQWPEGYEGLFRSIRGAGSTEFDEYQSNENNNRGFSVDKMKECVIELVRVAKKDRKEGANEFTLRIHTEPLVFAKLQKEMKCRTCSDFLWLSEFSAVPSDQVEATRLQRRRAKRLLCQCPPVSRRNWEDLYELTVRDVRNSCSYHCSDDEPGDTCLFADTGEAYIEYHRSDGLKERRVPKRRPDRVIGLARTTSLDLYLRAEPVKRLRHSPFTKVDILYPFLICEAKREENGPGFESIEMQTAFPIRTCIKLQEDLRHHTGSDFKSLVWFLSYEGDEWRVAACIKHTGKYKVIDLWMGRATSRDGALQLLLIIDLICEWARDIFRFEISSCLVGGRDNLRQESPTATYASRFSTQEPQNEGPSDALFDRPIRASIIPEADAEVIDLTETASTASPVLEDSAMEVDGLIEDHLVRLPDEGIDTFENIASHPLLIWAPKVHTEAGSTATATVRHSNMCLFVFSHLALPEDPETLVTCLRQAASIGVGTVRDIARSLMLTFLDQTSAASTTSERLLQLKNEWLRKADGLTAGSEAPLLALFNFHTRIRTSDWQLVRELWCISCTPEAIQALHKVSGVGPREIRISGRFPDDGDTVSSSGFSAFRTLTGQDAVRAALSSTNLYLTVTDTHDDNRSYRWAAGDESGYMAKSFALLGTDARCCVRIAELLNRDTALMEVLEKPLPREYQQFISTQPRIRSNAVLLSKGQHWPATSVTWCLMVMEEVDLDNHQELSLLLSHAERSGESYTFISTEPQTEAGAPSRVAIAQTGDEEFLMSWALDLSHS